MALSKEKDVGQLFEDYVNNPAFDLVFRYVGLSSKLDMMRLNKDMKYLVSNWFERQQNKLALITFDQWKRRSSTAIHKRRDLVPSCTVTPPEHGDEALISNLLSIFPNLSSVVIEAPAFLDPFITAIRHSEVHQSVIKDILVLVSKFDPGLNRKLHELFQLLPEANRFSVDYVQGISVFQDQSSLWVDLIKRRDIKSLYISPPNDANDINIRKPPEPQDIMLMENQLKSLSEASRETLEELSTSWCDKYLTASNVKLLLTSFPNLKRLRMDVNLDDWVRDPNTWREIFKSASCTNLAHLTIKMGAGSIYSDGKQQYLSILRSISKRWPRLQSLNIDFLDSYSASQEIRDMFPNVKLNLYPIYNSSVWHETNLKKRIQRLLYP